jgi:lysophospholipase L1-like esterase
MRPEHRLGLSLPMSRRLLPALLFATGASAAWVAAAPAQEIVLLAFGDSITEGYGDTSSLGGGYTRRLERWIDQEGYNSIVENHGEGGETTFQGLSRIDEVLALGGDYLLLMEGTNDVTRHVGLETISFNLNEMALRAEALGMTAVHATVIPRLPTAHTDSGNTRTAQLAQAIRELGLASNRVVVDNFALFQSLPNLFENYYYNPAGTDPVGHPNTDGYIQIAGNFLEALLPVLDGAHVQILPPPGPLKAGALAYFGIANPQNFVRVEWDFGDGGFAVATAPGDLSALYMYVEPGTYTVGVRAFTASGEVAEHSVSIVVAGGDQEWETRTALLPVVVDSADGLWVSDLRITNAGIFFGIAEVTFVPELKYDAEPQVRRFTVANQGTTTVPDVVGTAFGKASGRGALKVTIYVVPAGNPNQFTARTLVRASGDPDGSEGAYVNELPAASWTAGAKQIQGIPHNPVAPATLVVANLDAAPGTVRFDLYDAVGGYIGSGVLELAGGRARLRSLADLFRGLNARPAPFRAVFSASSVRYSAASLVTHPVTQEVDIQTATP